MNQKLLKSPTIRKLKEIHNRIYTLGMYWTEYRNSWLSPLTNSPIGDRLLDAGCGNAWIKSEFKRFDTKVDYFGIDLAVGDENLAYKVSALADLHYLPFKDNSFDKVTSNSVLEHVEDPTRVFSEMVRVTRVGGRIFLSVPFVFALHQRPYDYHRFTKYILELYAKRNNLKIIHLWSMGGFFTVLRYIFTNHTMQSFSDGSGWQFLSKIVNFFVKLFDRTIGAPIVYLLDLLDKNKYFSLGYFVVYEKNGEASQKLPDDPYRCPLCEDDRAILSKMDTVLHCSKCKHRFPINHDVPDLTLSGSFKPRSNKIHRN